MALVTLPFNIQNGQLIDANPVMANFNALATVINNAVVPLAGPATLTGVFTFTNSPQVPTAVFGDNSTNAASTAFVQQAIASVSGGSSSTFKNKIINGDMLINQRQATSGFPIVLLNTGITYFIDRWFLSATQANKFGGNSTGTQVIPNYNFVGGVTVSNAVAVPANSDTFFFAQRIETNLLRDLAFGTASASPLTLSFWIVSNVGGLHSGCLQNHNNTRSYVFTYTLVANTWTFITINIPGDTGGTWLNGSINPNVTGMELRLSNLGSGSNFLGSPGSWQSANLTGATGSVQIVQTAGATMYCTGVRLEKGNAVTTEPPMPNEVSLALCQRYFEKSLQYASALITNAGLAGAFGGSQPLGASLSQTLGSVKFSVTKRTTGTVVLYNPQALNNQIRNTFTGGDYTASAAVNIGENGFMLTGTSPGGSAVGNQFAVHWSCDAEL